MSDKLSGPTAPRHAHKAESDRARKLREARERKSRAVNEILERSRSAQRRQDASARAARMKLRRAGHPAPRARCDPGGDYCVVESAQGLEEFGYTHERFFLIRKDIEPEHGDLVLVEREPFISEGRALRLDGDDGLRIGIFGRETDGTPRLESLACGAYTFRLKSIIGKVIGPVESPAVLDDVPAEEEWPEYIAG